MLTERLRDPWLAYWQLMRFDKPIGTWLLLWPTLWALWLAGEGSPALHHVVIFVVGTTLMRAAGCVINDFADRNIDGHVTRTRARPLASGRLSSGQAVTLFVALIALCFVLVLFTNAYTVMLSFGGAALASVYPFMKRYTHWPQAVLGAAFAWGIPMAFGAEQQAVPAGAWLLYAAVLLWTVAYDTFYAMVDREDDLRIGVKSTAVLFGDRDRLMTAVLQALTLLCLLGVGLSFGRGGYYFAALGGCALLFAYQQWMIRHREPALCFRAFLHNRHVGALLFAGLVLDFAL